MHMLDSDRMRANVEVARGMAESFVDDNLDGDEDATEAIQTAEPPTPTFGQGLTGDNRARMGAMEVVTLVVALTVGAIVTAFLLPIGLRELTSAGLGDNASSGADALWGILDVIIVLAVFLFFIGIALKAVDRV